MSKYKVEDVEQFCSGLSDTQKEQWVEIANAFYDKMESPEWAEGELEKQTCLYASSKFSDEVTVPASALIFSESNAGVKFSKEGEEEEEQVQLDMVGYSGGVIKDHWWWDDLAIDLQGIEFTADKFPILENHDTDRKIAFTGTPLITERGLVADPETTVFLDNEVSQDFVANSKKGFPYQSSVYVHPTVIERVDKDAEVEVNGFKLMGPGTVFRKCEFKEMSACVFGWDSNTNATAFNKEVVLGKGCAVSKKFSEQVSDDDQGSHTFNNNSKEDDVMDLTKFKEEHPDLYKEVYESGVSQGKTDAESAFAAEKTEIKATVDAMQTRIVAFEKSETIRTEKELKRDAEVLFASKLSKSDIPEHLHAKVLPHVSYTKFVSDGVLDIAAFSEAIDTEIKSWQDAGISTTVMGSSFSTEDVLATEKAKAEQLEQAVDADVDCLLSVVQTG